MNTTVVIDAIKACEPAIRREGATALYIYGSRARGDYHHDSDLDVFIDYDRSRKFSLFDLAGIKLVMERALGLIVNVTTQASLHPRLRSRTEAARGLPDDVPVIASCPGPRSWSGRMIRAERDKGDGSCLL